VTRVDTAAAAHMLGMTVNNFRVYVHRHPGQIRRQGRDSKGRAVYDLDDVERVQALRRLATAA
jgi:hypothetical protein